MPPTRRSSTTRGTDTWRHFHEGSAERTLIAAPDTRAVFERSPDHGFSFPPAMSIYVKCENEAEIDRLFDALSNAGQVLMPLDRYPFSEKFAWLADKFGVSWQLSLAKSGPA